MDYIYIQYTLDKLGLSDICFSQTVNNLYAFKTHVKSILNDKFIHKHGRVLKIFEASKCIYHIIYKDTLTFEAYLNVMPFSLQISCVYFVVPIICCQLDNGIALGLTEISGYE